MRSAILIGAVIIQDGLNKPNYTEGVHAFIAIMFCVYLFFDVMDFIKKQEKK